MINECMYGTISYKKEYYCCEMQGWLKQCERNVKRQNDLNYNCVYCVKFWSRLNKNWGHASEKKNKRYI